MKRTAVCAFACLLVAGCALKSGKTPGYYDDLHYRDSFLMTEGLIHYGNDPEAGAFDDMYYAFVAGANEMAEASAKAAEDFRQKVSGLSDEDRAFLGYVFGDYADLAQLANYAYKDSEVDLPDGWTDMGADDSRLSGIIEKYSVSGLLPSGLKCSLMAKGDRRALVFAGTDFPGSWKDRRQVMDFIIDAYEDVSGALKSDASQVVLAGKLVDELLAEGYVTRENLEFAGHSLGGRLASVMAVRYGCPAVLFNAAGVSPEVYEHYEAARNAADDGWRGYIVDVTAANDPLTCAQKYMSGSTDPFVSAAAEAFSVDNDTMDDIISLGLGVLGAAADRVTGGSKALSAVKDLSDRYGGVVESLYERDYRALGAMMPIRENMGGHGIKELAAALRARAESCNR